MQVVTQRLYVRCMEEGLFARECRGDQAGEENDEFGDLILQGTYPCKSSKFYAISDFSVRCALRNFVEGTEPPCGVPPSVDSRRIASVDSR